MDNLQWRKARRSANNGACVELAQVNGQIAIRDSKDPEGPALNYSIRAFRSFLAETKHGQVPYRVRPERG